MKQYTKHLWLVAFLFLFLQSFAQVTKEQKPKKERITKAQATEKDVLAFINKNINKYDLTQEKIARLKEDFEEEERGHGIYKYDFRDLLLEIKRDELRKLYFKLNTASAKQKSDLELEPNLIGNVCVNGSFESGDTNEYTFRYASPNSVDFLCDINTDMYSPYTPSNIINNFSNGITIVDSNTQNAAGNDPLLESLGVHIPRVFDGEFAIKLNDNSPSFSVSTLNKAYIVDGPVVSYNFSLIMQNPDPRHHPEADQPHFIVRLYNSLHEIISENCIVADVDNTETFENITYFNEPLLFTRWQCGRIFTDGIQNGEEATLEFIITDCGQGAHYGTVYIDNICNNENCNSIFPEVHLDINPSVPLCPTFPLNICGTFIPPHSVNPPYTEGTLTAINLNILQGGNIVGTVNNATINDHQFCFELALTDFGPLPSGDYEYQAQATFEIGNTTLNAEDTSANQGPDAIFTGCSECPDCINITTSVAGTTDTQQAHNCINATNTITAASSSSAVYRAGKEVVLLPDFVALKGSIDRFYIEDCNDGTYVARTAAPVKHQAAQQEVTIDLVERNGQGNISIYPNPTNGELNIISGEASLRSITVTGLDGKVILKQKITETNASGYKLDINSLSSGMYLLNAETVDGNITSHKIIKN
ncbi:hypothetical protein Q765_04190 [Flavobacterium rivuli WB 3.3-2 = DSM 21788]|uniref:Secretion system C-terminal sorting domain-containing protein n=1 Tax=Flavobacterium rivuli WB 3.3-2 = DSM 21788 TaxID=1121895 RepID=A0A0A2M9E5_9FLAO|nr:T9SS type A sorting domain-containing protein [Flavobacterium rivuli]KGO88241.1 hypothetical protein Q765_04190 [Flavobacterium rivuli WB 3.3-2 = DSM 21788]